MSNTPAPTSPGAVPPEPPSLQKRLPLALALMMLVLLVSQYIFKPAPAPKPVEPENKPAAQLASKPAILPPNENAAAPSSGEQIHAAAIVPTDIDTDLYRISFTNRGAVVTSWVLKKFKDDAGNSLQLINTAATSVPPPFSIEFTGQ